MGDETTLNCIESLNYFIRIPKLDQVKL